MLSKLRSYRPSHATVVAYLALFVALGGSSYAAITLKKNSVKGKHIAKNAVTSPKVKDKSLFAQDFAPGQLPAGPQGAQGPQGEQGAQGQRGLQGVAGQDGADGQDGEDGFRWRGNFDCNASYAKDDVVFHEGSAYVATFGIGGCVQPPFAPWELLAQRGAQAASTLMGNSATPLTTLHFGSDDLPPSGPRVADGVNAAEQLSPNHTIVARDLFVRITQPPGTGKQRQFLLVDDASPTPVQCTIGAEARTCDSGSATATISPGSYIWIRARTFDGGAEAAHASWGWRATTP